VIKLVVQSWSNFHQEELTELAIRNLFKPLRNYRVSWGKYPPGTMFFGSGEAAQSFVLAGCCTITYSDRISIVAGDFVACPAGQFELKVDGHEDLEIVKVWKLPEEFQNVETGQPP
jgi:hypothetical protein